MLGIVTGITLIEVGRETRTLVFGCYSGTQYPDVGGSGLITATSEHWSDREIRPLLRPKFKVASLFHVDDVARSCSFDPAPRMCILSTSTPEPEPEPEGNDGLSPESSGPHKPIPATSENIAIMCSASQSVVLMFLVISFITKHCTDI